MENKYFIPNIEDIYFGYEFEYQDLNKKWHKCTYHTTYKEKSNFVYIKPSDLQFLIDKKEIRVLYLIKEQIIAEGWGFVRQLDDYNQVYTKISKGFTYTLYYYQNYSTKKQKIAIYIKYKAEFVSQISYPVLVTGALCKDINEFRKIIKLFEI